MFASIKLQRLVGLAVCLTMVVTLVSACGPAPTPTPTTPPAAATKPPAPTPVPPTPTPAGPKLAKEQVIRLPMSRLTGSIDPSLTFGQGSEWVPNLFDALTRIDPTTGKVLPLAAEKWEVSADGNTWTFTLKQGMTWSDGKPVTARDFVYAALRRLDPKNKAPLASDLFMLRGAQPYNAGEVTDPATVGVKAVDERTVQYTLVCPRADFPRVVAAGEGFLPLPQWAIEKHGDKWMEPGNIVVNGPYTISVHKPDQVIELTRNEAYKGKKPTIEKAIYVLFEKYKQQSLLAFEAGDVDIAWIPGTDLERVTKDAKLSKMLVEFPVAHTANLIFDTSNKPFDDVRVRRAFSLAVDREKLNNIVLKKQFAPAYTAVPELVEGYAPSLALKYDPEEAKKLLAEAGYPGGKGMREIELTARPTEEIRPILEAVQAMWQETLGVKVKVNLMEEKAFRAWFANIKEKKEHYDIQGTRSFTINSASGSDWFNVIFHPKADYYTSRWENAAFADLIDKAQCEKDATQRAKMYQEAEAMLLADMPVIPLYHTVARWVIPPYIKGIVLPIEAGGTTIDLRDLYIEAH